MLGAAVLLLDRIKISVRVCCLRLVLYPAPAWYFIFRLRELNRTSNARG